MRRLISTQKLEKIFRQEQIENLQIESMGGRFLLLTFCSDNIRDEVIKERWLGIWFEELAKTVEWRSSSSSKVCMAIMLWDALECLECLYLQNSWKYVGSFFGD